LPLPHELVPRDRLLVIDEDLAPRLAATLKQRDRNARSVADLGLRRSTDPELLRELAGRRGLGDWILVTGNDGMPAEHPELFDRLGPTVATIDPRRPQEVSELQWRADVVHRWAHAIQEQENGTVRRYSLARSVIWTPRRRHARFL
jgi:hypothetical protein